MIRFALMVAALLGFALTAALCGLQVPLRQVLRGQPEPPARPQPAAQEKEKTPEEDVLPCPATPPPLWGGLSLALGTLAAAGIGWTAACAAQPELLLGDGLTTRLVIALGGALAFGAVGAADDWAAQRARSVLGLRRAPRLALEICAAALTVAALAAGGWLAGGVSLPGAGYVSLGGAAPVLWGAWLVALAECARMADGADGTVCGAAFAAMLGLMLALTRLGWFALAVAPAAAAGAAMAFLLWNFPPARLRCGRTGCLFLAGLAGCGPLAAGWPELAVPLALPFWLEGGMVALQILWVRLRGRALLCGAPLHRWLQKRGAGPVTVFYVFCALALAGAALTVLWAKGL